MTIGRLPPWIVVERGPAPILLLAPHAGRRHDARVPGKHKVNDLHTGEVTRALARALGASAVINERIDRNDLDLNRVRQVRQQAPWLVELLAEMLREMIAVAGRATVLVIHGWNVSQVACDVGVGMRESPDGLVPVRAGSATVTGEFVGERLRPLQTYAAAAGITVTIGSRYPAAHPNNLLQIFRADGDDQCPVATLCRGATIDAAQLELAIPLRWPGVRRERFVALLETAFRASEGRRRQYPIGAQSHAILRARRGRVTRRRGVQLVAGDLLVMASVDAGDEGPIAGRVVVSEHSERLALFTGELVDVGSEWTVPPLVCECGPAGVWRVRYDGPVVSFPRHTPFLDLERGLADGTVVEARLDLSFAHEADAGAFHAEECFGAVRGEVVIDGRRYVIETRGCATRIDAPARFVYPHCRMMLPTGVFGAMMIANDPQEPAQYAGGVLRARVVGTVWRNGAAIPVGGAIEIGVDGETGSVQLTWAAHEPGSSTSMVGRLERVIPVRRPGPFESVVETTFALVRVDGRANGWLELSVVRAP